MNNYGPLNMIYHYMIGPLNFTEILNHSFLCNIT